MGLSVTISSTRGLSIWVLVLARLKGACLCVSPFNPTLPTRTTLEKGWCSTVEELVEVISWQMVVKATTTMVVVDYVSTGSQSSSNTVSSSNNKVSMISASDHQARSP